MQNGNNIDDIFMKHLDNVIVDNNGVVEEEKPQQQVIQQQPKQEIQQRKPKDMGQVLAQNMLNQISELTKMSGENFGEKERTFAIDIITNVNKMVVGNNYEWKDIDLVGCGFVNQIKKYAKLGVSMEDKLYVDIRNNGKTDKKDITIKPQYQTLEKIMVQYFDKTKPIKSFKTEVLCIGDEFETDFDFETGEQKVVSFKPNKNIDRNKLENITGAFKVIFYYDKNDNNKIKQIVTEIDKNRIMRAYGASPSREKTVWNNDTQKMVKKTVTWEAYGSDNVRPFMKFPDDIINDIDILSESEGMEWNKETKHKDVIDVQSEVRNDIGTGDKLNI